jgi:hypothetical protein
MKWLWIAALLLFAVLAAGAWWAASQPGFWIGLVGALVTAAVPFLRGLPFGKATKGPLASKERIRKKWGR